MSELVSREQIAQQALHAAQRIAAGHSADNPYPAGSEAGAAFDATLERYLTEVAGAEGSA